LFYKKLQRKRKIHFVKTPLTIPEVQKGKGTKQKSPEKRHEKEAMPSKTAAYAEGHNQSSNENDPTKNQKSRVDKGYDGSGRSEEDCRSSVHKDPAVQLTKKRHEMDHKRLRNQRGHNTPKASDSLQAMLAEIKRFVPLQLIYEAGAGACASAEQQRAAELIHKVATTVFYGKTSAAFEKWRVG
jgi:hypothetical protein